jgi:hypothetical protein
MLGAAASHAFAGDTLPSIVIPFVMLALGVASYMLRPDSRRIMASKTS